MVFCARESWTHFFRVCRHSGTTHIPHDAVSRSTTFLLFSRISVSARVSVKLTELRRIPILLNNFESQSLIFPTLSIAMPFLTVLLLLLLEWIPMIQAIPLKGLFRGMNHFNHQAAKEWAAENKSPFKNKRQQDLVTDVEAFASPRELKLKANERAVSQLNVCNLRSPRPQ